MSVVDTALRRIRELRAVRDEKQAVDLARFEAKAAGKLIEEFNDHLGVLAKPTKRKLRRVSKAAAFMDRNGLGEVVIGADENGLDIRFIPTVQGREFIAALAPGYLESVAPQVPAQHAAP